MPHSEMSICNIRKQAIVKFYTMEYRKCGNFNSKNDNRLWLGASAIPQSVDFWAFEINIKTIAPTQKLYQSGHAIWWGEVPRILDTFVESYDFAGKTIVPFCTSGGSGIGSSAKTLESLARSGTWLEGKRFGGGESEDEMTAWIKGLGIE